MASTLRDARVEDLPAIFDIYNEQVLSSTIVFATQPRDATRDEGWLTERDAVRHPVIVAELDGEIAGWGSLSPWSPYDGYARTAENSVYVHGDYRRRGVARLILGGLIERARGAGLGVLIARIAEGNPVSIKLHESFGFEHIGTQRRAGEKFGRILDVELLDLQL